MNDVVVLNSRFALPDHLSVKTGPGGLVLAESNIHGVALPVRTAGTELSGVRPD